MNIGLVIGIVIILALAALFSVLTCKSKTSDLFKWLGIAMFVAFCLTWVIPYGYFSAGTFYDYGMSRLGLSDIPTLLYYALYFCITTVIYLLVIGGFYGVFSKTKAYSALVNKFADSIKGKEVLTTILTIVILVCLTSVLKSALCLVVFLPFLVSVLLKAKYDKLTATGITFGSLLVGMLGATYGTEGLVYFNSYLESVKMSDGIIYRLILGVMALVLFVLYNVYRTVKIVKKNKKAENMDDAFAVEEVKEKTRIWPAIVVFSLLFVFIILGYIGWNTSFGLQFFDNIHKSVTELSFFKVSGEDFKIFNLILGTSSKAFGMMDTTTLIVVMLFMTLLVSVMNRVSVKDTMNNFGEGFMKMVKPATLYTLAYVIFIVIYLDPFTATISDWLFGLTKSFNPYTTMLTSFITSIFHQDLGYTSYLLGTVLTTTYKEYFELAHTIFIFMYGFVQVFMPTSCLLLVGLSYMKVDYKSWFKYIWMFAVAMVVVLIIFVSIVMYLIPWIQTLI